MFDTKEQILDQLRIGEDSRVEFKEVRVQGGSVTSSNPESLAAELVALANAEGGVVFLGVDDDGVVRGIPDGDGDAVEQWIVNIATNNCEPPLRPVLRKVLLPRLDETSALVLVVEIKRGLYVHRTSGGRYYVRVGSSKRDLRPEELARLLQQRGRNYVFDEQAVLGASLEDLDFERLKAHFGASSTIPWPDLLRNTRVCVPDEEQVDRPTVAGLLTFGVEPRRFLPLAYIEAACYRGEAQTSNELVHTEQIHGRVGDQIDAALRFVDRLMLRPARKDAGREDFPQFDLDATFEAIVNAVAHRDYSIAGSKIRLYLFADRLELSSPGALPNSLTLETMPYRVFTRNQLLVGFLGKLRSERTGRAFLESRGEGVRRILDAGETHSGIRPRFELFGEELRLTMWGSRAPTTELPSTS
jgi:predicted HTH transcriptional regulator